jgi:YHS domain-containing protein
MNSIRRFAVKGCLMTALGGMAFGQAANIPAQDDDTGSSRSSSGRIKQTASFQGADSPAAQSPPSTQSSDVTKELEKLYRKNGREMPSMNMEDLPNTQGAPPRIVGSRNGPATISSPTNSAQVKPSKPNWFERTFHVGRGRRQPQTTTPAPQTAPAPQVAQPAAPQAPVYRPAPAPQPAARPVAPVYRTPTVAVAPRTAPAAPPQGQLREPAPIGAPVAVPAVRAKPPSDFQPFGDDSKNQADSESLDIDRQKAAAQPPQILPNQNTNGPAESPYSGARISPNEIEQRMITSMDSPGESATAEKTDKGDEKPTATRREASPFFDDTEDEKPASRAVTEPVLTLPPPAESKEKSRGLLDEDDDDEDEDDDDDEQPLMLPGSDAKTAEKPPRTLPSQPPVPFPSEDSSGSEKPPRPLPAQPPLELSIIGPSKDAERPGAPVVAKAMRGWCPVVLKDERKLLEARPHIRSEYRGKIYTFSSVEAKQTFDDDPYKYAPAGNGIDVVKLAAGEPGVDGTLEHAAWYRGRLYLFASGETRREFVETPSKFRIDD